VFSQVAAGWCLGWSETARASIARGHSWVDPGNAAMFSPIIRRTWLYLQYLVVFTQVAAGWCLGWVETALAIITHHHPWVETANAAMFSPIIMSTWLRSEERRVGKEGGASWRSRWAPNQ
jgi:hypothetical protein